MEQRVWIVGKGFTEKVEVILGLEGRLRVLEAKAALGEGLPVGGEITTNGQERTSWGDRNFLKLDYDNGGTIYKLAKNN